MGTTGKILISVAIGAAVGTGIYLGFFRKGIDGKTVCNYFA